MWPFQLLCVCHGSVMQLWNCNSAIFKSELGFWIPCHFFSRFSLIKRIQTVKKIKEVPIPFQIFIGNHKTLHISKDTLTLMRPYFGTDKQNAPWACWGKIQTVWSRSRAEPQQRMGRRRSCRGLIRNWEDQGGSAGATWSWLRWQMNATINPSVTVNSEAFPSRWDD